MFEGFPLKRKSPHGDLKQETYRKHPVRGTYKTLVAISSIATPAVVISSIHSVRIIITTTSIIIVIVYIYIYIYD